jgi:hypothetical protein
MATPGDYVLATKYADGDPGDEFAVGWLKEIYDHYDQCHYIVVDAGGKPFRANGFRRCETITAECGKWLVRHFPEIEAHPFQLDDDGTVVSGKSVWLWVEEFMNGQ